VVTWTVAEAQALADVLTPDHPSSSWYMYDRLFDSYKKNIQPGAPALQENRLGIFFPTNIGNNTALCFKSELHLSQDGPKLPVRDLWRQIIQETQPKLVVTTGTAGGIGSAVKLGDVVIGRKVRFHCDRTFKNAPFNNVEYQNATAPPTSYFDLSTKNLIPVNASHLPPSPHSPTIFYDQEQLGEQIDVVTTDFFAYDNTTDTYQLQGLGAAVEMGDAVLGLVCQELGSQAPDWFAIRNASDPQIDGKLSLAEQKKEAAQIYEKYGYWTTIDSAIATWAVIAAS
jgi:nucleoside phosphorylase